MAQAALHWTPAGGPSSLSQDVQYRLLGDTSWTTFANVGPTIDVTTVTGLLNNELYEFQIVNNCSLGGPTDSIDTEGIVITCPTTDSNNVTYNGVDVQIVTQGHDISIYEIQLLNSSGTVVVSTQSITAPFSPTTQTVHVVLPSPNTTYKIKVIPKAVGNLATYTKTNCTLLTVTSLSIPSCSVPTNVSAIMS